MSKRYFEFSEGTSNKFWEVWMDGSQVLTRYGKIGATGQTTVKDEGSVAGAQKLYDKLIREKTGKGYQEKSNGAAAPPPQKEADPKKEAAPKEEAAPPPPPRQDVVVEPGFRRFEFSEGSSNKFWEVKVEGEQQIVRYGKIGTAGQTKEKDFDSAGEAKADTKKLIAEKTGKGYVEVGVKPAAPSNPQLEAAIAAKPDDASNWRVFADWLIEHGEPWGEVISAALQGKPDKARQDATAKELLGGIDGSTIEWANGVIAHLDLQPGEVEEEGQMEETLARILEHPAGHFIRKLTLGLPPHEDTEWHMEGLAEAIVEAGPLPFLELLDMSPDAEHMDQPSWRRVGDLSGLWKAAPHLKELLLQGAQGSDDGEAIDFGDVEAPFLEKLSFTSGGLNKNAPTQLGAAKLPKMKHLELMFGTEDYGCSSSVASLKGILDGAGLPAIERLGLMNSEWEEDLIKAVAGSKLLPRLKVLDFSMGVMNGKAADTLAAHAEKFKHLKELILTDNYFSEADQTRLKKLLPNAVFGEQKDDDDPEYRYTTIAE
ncbi:MAG: WGR domain-containing protein [Myxococcales bacterium]|nr:WGR domain-containing protein [Myxococcales bacterium]